MTNIYDNWIEKVFLVRNFVNELFDSLTVSLMFLASKKDRSISAKNSRALNDAKDFQKIKTAEFKVPVIYAGVLEYAPGELGDNTELGRKGGKVYYTPDSISDPEYLETVWRSAINIATHEKNTNEDNRDVDGWPREVYFDKNVGTEGAVILRGYAHGEKNIDYIKDNMSDKSFGASAYIDFLGVVEGDGVTPSGEAYTAKTTKLVNNHVAVLPNIRDRKNVIMAMNALNVEVKNMQMENANNSIGEYEMDEKEIARIAAMAAKNAVEESKKEESEDKKWEKIENSLNEFGERLGKLENQATKNKAKNESYEGEETPKEEAEEEDEKKAENAKNAMPSQRLIKDVSESFDLVYSKTPSFQRLADDLGIDIKDKSTVEIVGAMNAKCKEAKRSVPAASNSSESNNFNEVLQDFGG